MTKMEFAQQLMLIRFRAGAHESAYTESKYVADLTDTLWELADQRGWVSGSGGWYVDRAGCLEKRHG